MNNLTSKVGKISNLKIGQELIKDKELKNIVRIKTVNEMCVGVYNTLHHRLSANAWLDYKDGDITLERYEEIVKPFKHLL